MCCVVAVNITSLLSPGWEGGGGRRLNVSINIRLMSNSFLFAFCTIPLARQAKERSLQLRLTRTNIYGNDCARDNKQSCSVRKGKKNGFFFGCTIRATFDPESVTIRYQVCPLFRSSDHGISRYGIPTFKSLLVHLFFTFTLAPSPLCTPLHVRTSEDPSSTCFFFFFNFYLFIYPLLLVWPNYFVSLSSRCDLYLYIYIYV